MTEPIPACEQCGQPHVSQHGGQACTAHVKNDRETGERLPVLRPCTHAPINGLHVCWNHGGAKKSARAAGQRRHTEQQAEKVMRRFGEPINTTPTEALLETVRWTAGYVAWLRDKVAAVESDEALIWGVTKETEGDMSVGYGPKATLERGESKVSEAKPNAWLALLGEWHDRLVKICSAAISAGIEERRVRIAEQQGALVADVIKAILADLGLTGEQQAKVAEVVPKHLRLLTA